MSEVVVHFIFKAGRLSPPGSFHALWTLDGWNHHIIQPALDAVLSYFKVRTVCPISIYPVLTPKPF